MATLQSQLFMDMFYGINGVNHTPSSSSLPQVADATHCHNYMQAARSLLFGDQLVDYPGPYPMSPSSSLSSPSRSPSSFDDSHPPLPYIEITPAFESLPFDSPFVDVFSQLSETDSQFDQFSGSGSNLACPEEWRGSSFPTPSRPGPLCDRPTHVMPASHTLKLEEPQITASDPIWWTDMKPITPHLDPTTSRNLSPFEHLYSSAASVSSSPFSSAPHSPMPCPRTHSPTSSMCSTPPPTRPASPRPSSSPWFYPSPSTSSASSACPTSTKVCSHCKATSTPLWRRDPNTHQPLCNACGLYLQHRHKMRPQALIDADGFDEEEDEGCSPGSGPQCSHCQTRNTSVWRRGKDGTQVCNACGVYQRLRGKPRPLSLKRNRIKPRTKRIM